MASKTISFTNPLDPVGSQLEQQQIARQQAIADALRQQSLEQVDAGRGRVSWTQGVAKLAQALAAKRIQGKVDNRTLDYGKRVAAGLRGAFGRQPTVGIDESGAITAGRDQYGSGGVEDTGTASPSTYAPTQPQPVAQSAPSRGPLSLSGDPNQDMTLYMADPENYMKAVTTAATPTDFTRQLIQAGIDPNSPLGHQMMQSQVAKQNYVAPVTGRPGAIQRDPYSNAIIGVDPQNIEGANPVIENGQFTGRYSQAPGATDVIAATTAAKSGAQAGFEPVQVFNPATGQMEWSNKANVSQNGAAAAPALGAQAAYNVTGTNSANAFQAISDGAADVPNRLNALHQMAQIVNNPNTILGPGSQTAAQVKGVLGTIGQSVGIEPPASVDNYQEMAKWASQYSARSAQELGLSGSDARVQLAIHATPNGEMTKGALQNIIPQMVGMENAKQGYAVAANQWQQSHGPQSVQQFRTEWNRVYDPRIYSWMAQGPQAFAANVKNLKPAEAQALRQKYVTLKAIGALPQ